MLTKNNKINYISRETKIGAENLNNIQDSVLYNTEKVKKLSKDTEEISSQLEQIDSKINNVTPHMTTFFDNYVNLFDVSKISIGAILKDSGYHDTSFTEWRASEWIPVKAGTHIYFGNNGAPYITHLGALYDINKNYLSPINDVADITVAYDGYMRVSQNGGFPKQYQIQTSKIKSYVEYGSPVSTLKDNYLDSMLLPKYTNKKYLLMGDSITELNMFDVGWVKYFNEIVKPSKITNVAVAGATWKDKEDTPSYDGNPTPNNNLNVIGNQVQKVINQKNSGNSDYDDFDVIIIACGTNDTFDTNTETIDTVEGEFINNYNTSNYTVKPVGEVNRKTFPGIMRYTYEKLYELYPNAVFFVTTPIQEVYENYIYIKAKGDFIDYIADRLSINTINTRRCGILNTYESPVGDIDYDNPTGSESLRKRDLSDGIHTNASGAKKLGEYIARDIINYFNF